MKKILALLASLVLVGCSTPVKQDLKKVSFILDWTPNTNHTGLFVAVEKGYFKEIGIDFKIEQPPEGSTTELIMNNKAPFGISFQDSLANRYAKGANVTAVAAIIEHNTSGIISLKESSITTPLGLNDKKYGTWNDPIELKMIESVMQKEGGNFNSVKLVPNDADNSIVALSNHLFDAAWVYYAWDGMMAENKNIATNFFLFKDYNPVLDYYSPVIIANNDYLKNNKQEAKKIVAAIKKGYQYAMDHPQEAAQILIKASPELKSQAAFIEASQVWISKQYASNKANWGHFDKTRWNAFYNWLNENHLLEIKVPLDHGFTNEFLGE